MNTRILLLALLVFFTLPGWAKESVPDIRVAIDVSGSMKKNDPKGLRTPALKLLVGLMPDGMYSGVWTFGQYVNMQVKYGKVDTAWKKQARAEADKIQSRGLYTNIEEAIQRASFNWKKPDARFNRNLILLTDGMVDITRDAEVNAASRKRILEYWLPRLKKVGVRVHSVALSDEVDRELLTTISARTGGWFEQVTDAKELQRVFLRLFEKSARQDSLPLKGNRFHVDKNIEDMTLLVFHDENASELRVNTPAGERWSESKAPGNVTWFHEDSYDLITVKNPEAGDWVLETESEPDNRIMVVTNLRLKVNALPDHLLLGENMDVSVMLKDKERTITNKDFLKLVEFSLLDQIDGQQDVKAYQLIDNGKVNDKTANDGVYSHRLNENLQQGNHTLVIRSDGATFQREFRHTFNVYKDIASIEVTKVDEEYRLNVNINKNLINPDSVQLSLADKNGENIQWQHQGAIWKTSLPTSLFKEKVSVLLEAKRQNGDVVKVQLDKLLTPVASPDQTDLSKEQQDNDSENKQGKNGENDDGEGDKLDNEHQEDDEGSNWMLITWLTILINLVLIILGVLVWLVLKKRKAKSEANEDEELKV